jgi:quercetin dioxygenase-like cupin family protein
MASRSGAWALASVLLVAGCGGRPASPDAATAVGTQATTTVHTATATATAAVGERLLLDNERMTVYEYVFPPGFRGEVHAAIADEMAAVVEGELTVVTVGQGTRVLGPGQVDYAARGTVHYTLNQSTRPARVVVVLLKDR